MENTETVSHKLFTNWYRRYFHLPLLYPIYVVLFDDQCYGNRIFVERRYHVDYSLVFFEIFNIFLFPVGCVMKFVQFDDILQFIF